MLVGWAGLVVTDELVTHVITGEAVGENNLIKHEVILGYGHGEVTCQWVGNGWKLWTEKTSIKKP